MGNATPDPVPDHHRASGHGGRGGGGDPVNAFHLEFCASPEWRQTIEEIILPRALEGVDLGPDALEIGPGPGFTTDVLMTGVAHLTAVEVDPALADALATRLAGTNVDVVRGDAGALAFGDDRFTGGASFHMLHHIETDETQRQVFSELARVLKPGATLVAADGIENDATRAFHVDDVYNPIAPDDLRLWLAEAGFSAIEIGVYDRGWMCTARA
jgi:SAM-dependent methyltransferase